MVRHCTSSVAYPFNYARRCHLCKELAPVWERLADELEGEQYVAKVRTVINHIRKHKQQRLFLCPD